MFSSTFRMPFFILISIFLFSCEQSKLYPWSGESLDKIIDENSKKMILVDFETDW